MVSPKAILLWTFLLSAPCISKSQGVGEGSWVARTPLPTPRQEMPHAVIDGKVYVIGGLDRIPSGSTLVEVFDPRSNSWETKTEMPFPLHHHGVAAVDGRLYVLGGYQRNTFNSTVHLFEYDPVGDKWTILDPMPTSRGAHAVAVLGGKIYVIGGVSFGNMLSSVEVYDPATGSWISAAPLLTPREHHTAAVADSTIYVIGGRIPTIGNIGSVEAYDPSTDSWSPRRSLPTPRSGLASAAYAGRIFVFGGEIPGVYEQNEMYDPKTDSWTTMAPMPTARHGIGAAVVGDTIFVIGGAPNQGLGLTDVNQGFVPPASIIASSSNRLIVPPDLDVEVYPNPASEKVRVDITTDTPSSAQISLTDILGRQIKVWNEWLNPSGQTQLSLQTQDLPPGVYVLEITQASDGSGALRSASHSVQKAVVVSR